LESEVRQAIKNSPKNKAAGVDEITTEAILACGKTGIQWLTTIFQKAWRERKVPEDWQAAVVVPIWKEGEQEGLQYIQGNFPPEPRSQDVRQNP
jgi:hypothetical protein